MKNSLRTLFALCLACIFAFSLTPVCFADGTTSESSTNIEIMKHPGNSSTYTNEGSPYSSTWFSVRAIGAETYTWQIKYTASGSWHDIPDPDVTEEWTDGLIVTIKLHLRTHEDILSHVGCSYRCVLYDADGNSVTTNSATIYNNPPATPPAAPPAAPPNPYPPSEPHDPIIITPHQPACAPSTIVTTTTTTVVVS